MKNIKHHLYPDSKQTSSTQNFKSNLILMYVTFQLCTCNWNLQHRLATILGISAFSWSLPPTDTSSAQALAHQSISASGLTSRTARILILSYFSVTGTANKASPTPVSTAEIWGGAGELTVLISYSDTSMKASAFLVLFFSPPPGC